LKGKLKVARPIHEKQQPGIITAFKNHYLKQQLKNLFFTSIDDVKVKVAKILTSLAEDIIHSLTGWQYILDALSL
jgi:hypothetical protein